MIELKKTDIRGRHKCEPHKGVYVRLWEIDNSACSGKIYFDTLDECKAIAEIYTIMYSYFTKRIGLCYRDESKKTLTNRLWNNRTVEKLIKVVNSITDLFTPLEKRVWEAFRNFDNDADDAHIEYDGYEYFGKYIGDNRFTMFDLINKLDAITISICDALDIDITTIWDFDYRFFEQL